MATATRRSSHTFFATWAVNRITSAIFPTTSVNDYQPPDATPRRRAQPQRRPCRLTGSVSRTGGRRRTSDFAPMGSPGAIILVVGKRLWIAGLLVAAGLGLTAVLIYLTTTDLADASSWTSIVGFFVSTGLGIAGLVVAIVGLRSNSDDQPTIRTGDVCQKAENGDNSANTGYVGTARGAGIRTGDVSQKTVRGSNSAVTGNDSSVKAPRVTSRKPGSRTR